MLLMCWPLMSILAIPVYTEVFHIFAVCFRVSWAETRALRAFPGPNATALGPQPLTPVGGLTGVPVSRPMQLLAQTVCPAPRNQLLAVSLRVQVCSAFRGFSLRWQSPVFLGIAGISAVFWLRRH